MPILFANNFMDGLQCKDLFKEKVIKEAREGSNVNGLYYNNNIESMHFKEKTKQCHKLLSSTNVIGKLRKIVQQH